MGGILGALAGGGAGLSFGTLAAVGAVAGAAGLIVSQAIGVATGLQTSFSWKGVALSALAGGVGGGVAKLGLFATFGKVGSAVTNGLLSSTVTQGIGVATGLQDKFSWAGVAAAGVAAGVGTFLGDKVFHTEPLLANQSLGNVGRTLLTGAARTIASAATRSLIEGTDFGDNVVAGLPDVIGQTIADLVLGGISRGAEARKAVATARRAREIRDANVESQIVVTATGDPQAVDYGSTAIVVNGQRVGPNLAQNGSVAYKDAGIDDGVTGGGASTARGGTTRAGDGTSAQPVAGNAGGGQVARGGSSRERSSANGTSLSGDAVNEIVVTADISKLKFLRSMNDGMYRIWKSELNFISKGNDYYYGNPFRMKGGVTYLTGGAGNDPNREYLAKMASSFEKAGIENIQIVGDSASGGYILDAASVILTNQAHSDLEYMRPVNVKVPDGQLNFVGYSWGSIQAAHNALRFASNGYYVDNVVLIGAPIEQSLMTRLATEPHIGRVTVINLTEFGDPIHAGMTDFQVMKAVPDLSRAVGTGTGHFSFAGTGFTADARRDTLGNILYYNGVR